MDRSLFTHQLLVAVENIAGEPDGLMGLVDGFIDVKEKVYGRIEVTWIGIGLAFCAWIA